MSKSFSLILSLFAALAFVACGEDSSSLDGYDWESSNSSSIDYETIIDNRDNQTYRIVTIGTQTWMAENLNYAYNEPTATEDSSSFCLLNSASYCAKYGRLYLWSAAMDSAAVFSDAGKGCGYGNLCNPSGIVRGVCPSGWHLPSYDEWNSLFTAVGGFLAAGTVLKSRFGWLSYSGVPAGTDVYDFSAYPAGQRTGYDDFGLDGMFTAFWSNTELSKEYAYNMILRYDDEKALLANYYKEYALSVRCLKD